MTDDVSSLKSEKQAVNDVGDLLHNLSNMASDDVSCDSIRSSVYRAIRAVVEEKISAEDGVERLRQCGERIQSLPSILADAFSVVDVETLMSGDSSDERVKFLEFVSSCLSSLQPAVQESCLKERLESETLESIHLIQSAKTFNQRYVKMKTKLFYKQQKFNLLREESEGYAKLITELGQSVRHLPAVMVLNNVKSLIGRFNLDPNRVLDVILEAFECQSQEMDFFLLLLKEYNFDGITVCQMVGFKFKFYEVGA
jgi:THO complex subunit 2